MLVLQFIHRIQKERDLRLLRQDGKQAELFDLRGGVFVLNVLSLRDHEAAARFGSAAKAAGVRRIIYTDISRDGTLTEPNFTAIAEMIDNVGLPVVAGLVMQLYAYVDGPETIRWIFLTAAFGGRANPGSRLPYRQVDGDDFWAYDPLDPAADANGWLLWTPDGPQTLEVPALWIAGKDWKALDPKVAGALPPALAIGPGAEVRQPAEALFERGQRLVEQRQRVAVELGHRRAAPRPARHPAARA